MTYLHLKEFLKVVPDLAYTHDLVHSHATKNPSELADTDWFGLARTIFMRIKLKIVKL